MTYSIVMNQVNLADTPSGNPSERLKAVAVQAASATVESTRTETDHIDKPGKA
ncbi:hypothetical protein IV102_30860 [bacterium]|nr:hypothetical protein [bacterium]